MKHPLVRFGLTTLLTLTAATLASAQVPLSGALSDSTTGPLLSGNVYHATGTISVSTGQTLTVEAGAIVKMTPTSGQFTVSGTLDVNGTSGSPVIFTVIEDDSAGGDTNANGPSSGSPGSWRGLKFNFAGSSGSTLDWCEVRYSGDLGNANVELSSSNISLNNCTLRDGSADGLDCNSISRPTVDSCALTNNADNADKAVEATHIEGVPNFTNNTATGNGGNYINVNSASLTGDLTLTANNCLGGAVVTGSINVGAGLTLTLEPGVVMKAGTTFSVCTINGTLMVNGTSGNPVVFTSLADDSAGGDANGDGPSVGAPADWRGVLLNSAADASVVDWLEVRYGGTFGAPNFDLSGADAALSNCTFRDGAGDGLDLSGNSYPTVDSCSMLNNADKAVEGVHIDAVPGFTNNTATGNGGNYQNLSNANLTTSATINLNNVVGGALVHSSVSVPLGETLTLGAGVVLKVTSGQMNVYGTLDVNGTEASPVVMTVLEDDSAAGDTNNDGPSSGVPGDWSGIRFRAASDASTLDWFEVRYGSVSNLQLDSADITASNCTISDAQFDGFYLTNTSRPTVRETTIADCGRYAVRGAEIESVPGFSWNTATGNGSSGTGGDYIQVTSFVPDADLTIEDHNVLGGALVSDVAMQIPDLVTLTLEKGVVVKMNSATSLVIYGSLECNGTVGAPVAFTSFHDDAVGGDTNKNGGATTPATGDWGGILYETGADDGLLRNVLVRYTGNFGTPGVRSDSPFVEFDGVRVDYPEGWGFEIGDLEAGTRLCVWKGVIDGIRIDGGSFDLSRLTSVANGGDGIDRSLAHTGTVFDSIAWNNVGSNFDGFLAGTLRYSNGDAGFAGSSGNIDTDPLFVDEPNGDLGLTGLSPCVDAGDPSSEQDPDCTRADMGCEYFDTAAPFTYCTSKTNSIGCLPTIEFVGFASATDPTPFTISACDVINQKSGIFFYGTSGAHNGAFQGGIKCVLSPVRRTPVQNSGGDPLPNNCSGTYAYDMNARIQSGADPALVPGVDVNGQFWMRDPFGPFTTGLTNGIQFRICP
jgi:hypothetical protein